MGTGWGYRDLVVWQEAMNLAVAVYRLTAGFPKGETYALTLQVRKSAGSIPSNIAEGAARNSKREFYQFLGVSTGSLAELETHLELAERLEYVRIDAAIVKQMRRVGVLLQAPAPLVQSLETPHLGRLPWDAPLGTLLLGTLYHLGRRLGMSPFHHHHPVARGVAAHEDVQHVGP